MKSSDVPANDEITCTDPPSEVLGPELPEKLTIIFTLVFAGTVIVSKKLITSVQLLVPGHPGIEIASLVVCLVVLIPLIEGELESTVATFTINVESILIILAKES